MATKLLGKNNAEGRCLKPGLNADGFQTFPWEFWRLSSWGRWKSCCVLLPLLLWWFCLLRDIKYISCSVEQTCLSHRVTVKCGSQMCWFVSRALTWPHFTGDRRSLLLHPSVLGNHPTSLLQMGLELQLSLVLFYYLQWITPHTEVVQHYFTVLMCKCLPLNQRQTRNPQR